MSSLLRVGHCLISDRSLSFIKTGNSPRGYEYPFVQTPTISVNRPSGSHHTAIHGRSRNSKIEQLFASLMRFVRFGRGRFFDRFVIGLDPLGVENSRFIDALVGVRAEKVALGLEQVVR